MTSALQGKTVLITGASAGIGRATAMTLARHGAHIIALGRREDALQQLQDALPAGRVRTLAGDLNDEAYLKQVGALAHEVDIFVNNAGVLRYAPLLDLSAEDCEWMFQTNVLASLKVTQILGRAMVARKAGHMVFMTSIAAREVYRLASVYCATKHALSALARSFRLELQGFGIKVTEVAPGMVDTEIRAGSDHPDVLAAVATRKFKALTAQEVADAVAYAVLANPNCCPDLIELRPQGSA
jgi:3-hydroxy acid dehydrogenase/malonic semialdehyde reductase